MSLGKLLEVGARDVSARVLPKPPPNVLGPRQTEHPGPRVEPLDLRLGHVTDENVRHCYRMISGTYSTVIRARRAWLPLSNVSV